MYRSNFFSLKRLSNFWRLLILVRSLIQFNVKLKQFLSSNFNYKCFCLNKRVKRKSEIVLYIYREAENDSRKYYLLKYFVYKQRKRRKTLNTFKRLNKGSRGRDVLCVPDMQLSQRCLQIQTYRLYSLYKVRIRRKHGVFGKQNYDKVKCPKIINTRVNPMLLYLQWLRKTEKR